LKGRWVEPDIRDEILTYTGTWARRTKRSRLELIELLGISRSKYYEWQHHYGESRDKKDGFFRWWSIEPSEEEEILHYRKTHEFDGYRRLCYQMLDEDVVAVSPSTVYRVLKRHNLLSKWNKPEKKSKKEGFDQPQKPHEHWHMDISYIKIQSVFFFLISVLDGYSRSIIHFDLRANMTEYDVELVLEEALEKYPGMKPRLISDNGSQFISRDFKEFISLKELCHVRTSIRYPQSNGKIESFHKTIKKECIRRESFIDLEDARKVIGKYINEYNNERLHSSLYYLSPRDVLEGRMETRLKERDHKLRNAREKRKRKWKNSNFPREMVK